jgi:hypothetical protein
MQRIGKGFRVNRLAMGSPGSKELSRTTSKIFHAKKRRSCFRSSFCCLFGRFASLFPALARQIEKCLRVGLERLGQGHAMDKLPPALAVDQPRILQNAEMVRDRSRRNPAHRNNLRAMHVIAGTDGLQDAEASPIREGFGDTLNFLPVHLRAPVQVTAV